MTETRCRVCTHAERPEIDRQLAQGLSNVGAAERWGFSKDGVRRHRERHLAAAMKTVAARRETAGARKAVDRVEDLYERALSILEDAEAGGKASLALSAVRELKGIVELLAKLKGELDERPQLNVLTIAGSPEWAMVRQALLSALGPYPEAGSAVARALAEIEA